MQRRRFQIGRHYQVGQAAAQGPAYQPAIQVAPPGGRGDPGCGFPAPRDPGTPHGCPTVGVNYCFTQASGENLNVAAAAGVIVVVTPTNASEAVPRSLIVSVFDTGLNTRVLNGALQRAEVFGDNQLGNAVGVTLDRFNLNMPYLAENWRGFTPQNPYNLTIVAVAAANVDIRVTMDCDMIKGSGSGFYRPQ